MDLNDKNRELQLSFRIRTIISLITLTDARKNAHVL